MFFRTCRACFLCFVKCDLVFMIVIEIMFFEIRKGQNSIYASRTELFLDTKVLSIIIVWVEGQFPLFLLSDSNLMLYSLITVLKEVI